MKYLRTPAKPTNTKKSKKEGTEFRQQLVGQPFERAYGYTRRREEREGGDTHDERRGLLKTHITKNRRFTTNARYSTCQLE
jgi:hypothetical protein